MRARPRQEEERGGGEKNGKKVGGGGGGWSGVVVEGKHRLGRGQTNQAIKDV